MRLSTRKRSDGKEWRRQKEMKRRKGRAKRKEKEKEAQIRIRLPKQATVQQKAIRRVKLNLAGGRCI